MNRSNPRSKWRARSVGFTLIELLVVVGIILLLLGLLLPALRSAWASARAVLCAANLKSIGTTTQLYVSAWKSRLPVNSYVLRDDPSACNPPLPPGTAAAAKAQLTGEGSTSNLQWHDAIASAAGWRG